MVTPQALELFRLAMAAARANDRPKTRVLLAEAVGLDPANEAAWAWLAGVAESPLEAVAAWERVLALNPNSDKAKAGLRPVRLQAGINAAKDKDISTALRLLRAVVADDPDSENGWLWLASVCDSPKEAMAHLKRVLAINPQNKSAKKGIEYYEAKLAKAGTGTGVEPASGVYRAGGPPTDIVAPTPLPVTASREVGPRKLLAIDASRTNRKLVGLAVGGGFTLIEAEDAGEAIDRIRDDGVPDLIVADGKMRGMDAFEFCKLLRQHPDTKTLPVVILAGADSLVDKLRGKMAGVTATVLKPVHPETLAAAVRACCPAVTAVA